MQSLEQAFDLIFNQLRSLFWFCLVPSATAANRADGGKFLKKILKKYFCQIKNRSLSKTKGFHCNAIGSSGQSQQKEQPHPRSKVCAGFSLINQEQEEH